MTSAETIAKITQIGIVPVVRAASADHALRAAEAVAAGGVPIVEVTMTVPGAIAAISRLAATMGASVLVGAGTVLDADTARRCIEAGAEFIVSPGFDPATVSAVNSAGKPMIPGALTPTEVIAAWKAGSAFVKMFPCGAVGGPAYLKALKAPLPQIKMIPTGGVNLATAADFIRSGAEALGVGGELISRDALKSGDLASITQAARRFIAAVREAREALSASTAK